MTLSSLRQGAQTGFTLVEMSVVLFIIALLTVAVLKGRVFIDSARSTDMVATTKDLGAAIADFKSRYRFLPGDLPAAAADMAGIAANAACDIANTVGGIGNGQIDTSGEIGCVSVHLSAAGLTSKTAADGSFNGTYGRVWVMDREASRNTAITLCGRSGSAGVALSGAADGLRPVLAVFEQVPADVGQRLDSEFDDGNPATGAIRGSAAYTANTILACFGMPVH